MLGGKGQKIGGHFFDLKCNYIYAWLKETKSPREARKSS